MITKSLYVKYIKCPKSYYNTLTCKEEEKTNDFITSIIERGKDVGEIGRNYFGGFYLVERDKNETMAENTKKAIDNNERVICEASFIYEDCFCSVDILKKVDGGFEIYEIKSSTKCSESHIDDCSFQYYVLTSLGYNIKSVNLLHINSDYVFKDKLDLRQLFSCQVIEPKDDVQQNIEKIRQVKNDSPLIASSNCKSCGFFAYCFKDLPKNNVFNLAKLSNAYDLYNKNIISFEDYKKLNIDAHNKTQKRIIEQIEYELNDLGIKVDKSEVQDFLDSLEYPIYHLDFETSNETIPFINGMKPYQNRATQYSIHIEEYKGAPMIHKEYLQESIYDNLEEVANNLIRDLGKKGTILAYNASFESSVIKKIGEVRKNKQADLNAILLRIKDLMIPFSNRNIYCKEMKGSYSIKHVLPALCNDFENAYQELLYVHNGTEAINAYSELVSTSGSQHEFIKNSLLKYCELDTLAMVEILKKIYELME